MLKKLSDLFASLKFTIVSGIFLIASLVLMLCKIDFIIDPAWVTVILSGYPLLYLAITRLLKQKWISSCLLISIAMIASLSLGEVFAAGEVAFIMAIGAILEDMTVARAKKGLSRLLSLTPKKGRRITTDSEGIFTEEEVTLEELKVGDFIRVKPGEVVPCDGEIITGETSLDQSLMTGESIPVDKTVGDEVFCGTINCYGSIDVKITKVGADSSLQKMIRLVEEADNKKAPMQRLADKWSVWLVPIALGIAIGGIIVNFIITKDFLVSLERGVTVLVVFCPCALALATPTSVMAAIGQATKHGVIIKSGEALEVMGKCDTIAFDKTGTITKGELEISNICSFNENLSENDLLLLCGSCEAKSEHPLGKAILKRVFEKNLKLIESKDFIMEAGRGVKATIAGSKIICGKKEYIEKNDIEVQKDVLILSNKLQEEGKALIYIAKDGVCSGLIALSDIIREDSITVVNELNKMDINSILLTGDNEKAGNYFAKKSGVKNLFANLLPKDKVTKITDLQKEGKIVCMVGDGVNDAPALKTADVGVAMGGVGSDIAVEASDVTLMQDNLSKLVYLKRLSKTCVKTIKFNITVIMCINAIAVTLSVLGVLNPVTGALVHNAGSCLVVLNAALLYDRKFE